MSEPPQQLEQSPSHHSAPRNIFVGRRREFAELTAALDDALSSRGRLVMLVGEPGIGKTRTAQELASLAETRGAQVLWGRCYEEQGTPPYWPWVQAVRSYVQGASEEQLAAEMGPGAADIAEIVPEIRGKLPDLEAPPALEPEQARFRLFDSITTFLKNSAQTKPLSGGPRRPPLGRPVFPAIPGVYGPGNREQPIVPGRHVATTPTP